MERKQKGEQFRIIDRATRPQKPISPNEKKIFLIFVVLGIGFGGGIIFVLEFFDNSFKSPDDVEKETGLNVLTTITNIAHEKENYLTKLNYGLSILFAFFTLSLFFGFTLVVMKGSEQTIEFLKKLNIL